MMQRESWMPLLLQAVAASNVTGVAKHLDVSHTTISLVLRGKYAGKTDKVGARVIAAYGQIKCSHTDEPTDVAACVTRASSRAPLNNPLALSHWRTCQGCKHNPHQGSDK